MFLPMIDMEPSNMTCIYSTLIFINEQAKRYSVTPVVTFDQPLCWKALMVVANEPQQSHLKSIVLRLGGLHIQMSSLGCIGYLMVGSGLQLLQDVLELIYAKNTVGHMLSGKAIARAIRGHFLVDAALNGSLVSHTFNVPLPVTTCVSNGTPDHDVPADQEEREGNLTDSLVVDKDLKLAGELYKEFLKDATIAEQVCSDKVLRNIAEKLENKRNCLQNQRTTVLWMQYMGMVDVLRKFIKADRTANWDLHLQAVYDMLPFFAAAGHNLHAKSAYIYLQMMHDLQTKQPEVYKSFQDGLHVVRRSDCYWAGLSTDLAIEQVLMRSIKTSGGLTRGRGTSATQRLVWLMSLPSCAEVNNAMQNLTGVMYHTSEQDKETTKARQERDYKDTNSLPSFRREILSIRIHLCAALRVES